jgi:hypothetical protein
MTSPFNHIPQSQGGHGKEQAPTPQDELAQARAKMAELAAKHDAVIDRLIEDVQRLRDLRRESIDLAVKIDRAVNSRQAYCVELIPPRITP